MRLRIAAAAAGTALALVFAGCASGTGTTTTTPSAEEPLAISFMTGSAEGAGSNHTMQALVDSYGNGATLEMEQLDASMDQRIQLLASQDQLPTFFQIGTPSQLIELHEAGFVADLEPVLEELGVLDNLTPFSVSVIKGLYGGKLLGLPLEVGAEGFWYNTELFAEHGIEPPETFADLEAAAATLQAAGVQPFATAGNAGWPVTRLIAGYLHRDLGPDALRAVADGEASFTDPEYVAAAQVVRNWADAGYFGPAPGALEYGPAQDMFLQGEAAIYYNGTWVLSDFTNPEVNQIGEENIGWFPIPAVEGGAGEVTQTPANVGLPMAVNAKTLTPEVKEFLKYLVENYGTVAMEDLDIITGFQTDAVSDSPLVAESAETISGLTEFVPWFEALQSPEGTAASQEGGTALVSGGLTAEQFMEQVQAAQ
ncbi:ABC transporter substrate-binding protein [Propioniciclava soli]|uniref:Extracellular solute-binding protein n=1 Tax=Propioniciclava soli TaxID=2775081 RepID=A0ABZ3C8T9_9ACTN|nr:extracellular solute-binding protein [Propioniciclava soli]